MKVNWEWVENDQLKKAGYGKETPGGKLVRDLLTVLEEAHLKKSWTEEAEKCVEYAITLYKGQPIVEESDDEWTETFPGDISVRDIVRVKRDGYVGDNAHLYNGRKARVVGLRGGVVTVVYDDTPEEPAVMHNPTVLEKLVVN